MTKTKKIIIFVITVIVLGLMAWWLYARNTNNTDVRVGNNSGGFNIKNFLPFGNPDTAGNSSGSGSNSNNNGSTFDNGKNAAPSPMATNVPIKKLRKLWDKPVAGAVIFNMYKSTTSIVRFTEKATGNVYEARSDSAQVRRLSNETIPKIMRAFWLPDGSGFLSQTIDENETIETSFIKLKASTASSSTLPFTTVISKLPTGIAELSVSPNSKKIFYYTAGATAKGFVSNTDGTSAVNVYGNYLTEWLPFWFNPNSILLAEKASYASQSSGYFLNPDTKTLTKAYGNISGASSLPRGDSKFVLLGSGADPYGGSPALWLLESSAASISALNTSTWPEKCAWNKADAKFVFCGVPKKILPANYPDDWYRGTVNTDDLIEKINISGYSFVLSDLSVESKETIDTENLASSPDGNFLIFQNKLDQSLWMLDTR